MSHAPTLIAEWLRSALRRGVMLIGVMALVLAAAFPLSVPKALGLFDAHHFADVTDCPTGGDDGCAGQGAGPLCSLHGDCVSIGVLPAGPIIAASPGRDRAVVARASLADWADFPAKPPPISLS